MDDVVPSVRERLFARQKPQDSEPSKKKVVGVYNVGTTLDGKHLEIPSKPEGAVRFVCFSDTHSQTRKIPASMIPPGDVMIHAGDWTYRGGAKEVQDFSTWLGTLPYKHKIVIAGNHDITFEDDYYDRFWRRYHDTPEDTSKLRAILSSNCTYLEDSEVTVEGVRIYGTPWQPEFCNWAFNVQCPKECKKVWEKIPIGIDVLISHGPTYKNGDLTVGGSRAGCKELLETIQTRLKPAAHVCGHIHEGYGVTSDDRTTYINASNCNFKYSPIQLPIVFDLL